MSESKNPQVISRVRECHLVYRRGKGIATGLHGGRISSSRDATPLIRKVIPDGPQERFIAIALDAKNKPIAYALVGAGGMTSAPVSPADAVRVLIVAGAISVIFAHNHPSGDTAPSPEDVALTERLLQVCDLVGIKLVDHIIVARNGYFSFLDSGLLTVKADQ